MNKCSVANALSVRHVVAVLLSSALLQVGCGARETYQVSGRVQYEDGSPITGGVRVIRFEPTQDTTATVLKAASGKIAPDGTFELFSRQPGDGVYAGKYAVTFTVRNSAMDSKSLVPEKFTRGNQSPFDVVVDEDKSGLLFELEKL